MGFIEFIENDIIFDNREEAENVLSKMKEVVSMYGIVSVADLCDIVGIDGHYMDFKRGWTDINGAQIVEVRNGYSIKFPNDCYIFG